MQLRCFYLLPNEETSLIQKLLPVVIITTDYQRLENFHLAGDKESKLSAIKKQNSDHETLTKP